MIDKIEETKNKKAHERVEKWKILIEFFIWLNEKGINLCEYRYGEWNTLENKEILKEYLNMRD